MAGKSEWSITEPRTLTFDDHRVEELSVRVVNGTVNVVGTDDPVARVEISHVEGPPLIVQAAGGRLTVAYDDLPWQGFLKWLDRKGWRRSVVVSVSVPAASRLTVGVVGASAVVSGIAGRTDVRGVSGDTTLVGLGGTVRADTVSGDIEAQALGGELRFSSVSGNLTVIDSQGPSLRGESVSGDMMLDLAPSSLPPDIRLNTVSGELALRLPEPFEARVTASTAAGGVSSAFPELRVGGGWGARQLTGTLGSGTGAVRCSTVSGAIALLRRPPAADAGTAAASSSRKDA
ncbi:DUF4097 family beta strand repeat-containing protein [Streptomyces sp. NBC_01803]|uniref:DUF4097 family beta strand repeat-containing protein n=1 Tax=Streptomyces sp. NBC_01803 TaxID=2975946 RepID=UPI002DDAE42D|nr:DUF4097 family beta strand repeat-containing protein [Streptomyces sp. NBC_01803]WSA44301.1 DUF4097 domain-containing protein [Streptomyces sp. NBC_01803]